MSGGGAKGAFQLGVVDHLIKEKNLDFDVIAGVSVGSLNAVVLAQGRGLDGLREKLEDLEQLWFGLPGNEGIYRKRFLGKLLVFIFKDSILDPGPLKEQMDTNVEEEKLRQSGKEFRIGAVTLESGEYVVIDQNTSSIKEWTLASSSMPLAFPPVKIDSDHAVDGGIRNITPLREAFTALKNAGGGSVVGLWLERVRIRCDHSVD